MNQAVCGSRRRCVALLGASPAYSILGLLPTRLAAQAAPDSPGPGGPAEAAEPAPWPSFTTLEGRSVLPPSAAGGTRLIVFWAGWCGYCKRHLERASVLIRAGACPPERVLALAVDTEAAEARRLAQAAGWAMPVALAPSGFRARYTPRRTVPFTVRLDAKGRVLERIPGEMTEADWAELLRQAGA